MRRILGDLRIPLPQPVSGALWAARGHVNLALVAIAEIAQERMRHYGELSEDDAQTIDKV
jgi:hypothetical protein